MVLCEFLVIRASSASHIFMCACSSNSVRAFDSLSSVSTPWLASALPCGSRATDRPIGADALHIAVADTRARPPPTAHRGLCPRARHSHARPPRAPAAVAGARARPSPTAQRSPCPPPRHTHVRPPGAPAAVAATKYRPSPPAHCSPCPRARHTHGGPPRAPAAVTHTMARPPPAAHRGPCPRARHTHGRPPRAAVARTRARPLSSRDATRPLPPCAAVAREADSGTDSSGRGRLLDSGLV